MKELGAVAGLAVIADLAFWKADGLAGGGFGLAVFFLATPLALLAAVKSWRASARLGVIAGLLGLVVLRCAFAPTAGTILAGLALLGCFVFTLRARRMFLPETFLSMLAAVAAYPSRVGAAFKGVQRIAARTRFGRFAVLPVLVPVLLVAVFAGVFALANPMVASAFQAVGRALARIIALPPAARVFLWVTAGGAAVALLRPGLRMTRGTEAAPVIEEAHATSVLVARNAFVGLNALFFAYNALDAAYLWAGVPPVGTTTQEYAHAGTFWLTTALSMLTAVVGWFFRGALAFDATPRAKLARTLAYAWAAQGLVLAAGTYRRIGMHVAHSGLSDLRIVGILGTTLVALGVVLVCTKLHRRRTLTWLVRRQLDAFAVTLCLYAVFPTHLVAASVNVARIESGEYRPLLHMFRQSARAESVATLVPLLDHEDVRVRQGVAALLEQERASLHADVDHETSWRERDLTGRRALDALDAAAPQTAAVLGNVDRDDARRVLLEISRVANEDRSLEELFAIPAAVDNGYEGGRRGRGDL